MKKIWNAITKHILPIIVIGFVILSTVFAGTLKEGDNPDAILKSLFSFEIKTQEITYNEFMQKVENKEIEKVYIDYNASTFNMVDKKENKFITDNPRKENFKEFLLKNNIKVEETDSLEMGNFLFSLLSIGLVIIMLVFFINRNTPQVQMKNQSAQIMNKELKKISSITFKDIAGHEGVKKDVQFIVDFLKKPSRYRDMGARMPKGIILYGSPGNGKTLLAKAIAGEAGVPFFSVSGSDFVEMYVGVGAKRVRNLFAEARKKAPSIIFIDEIDAIGKKRSMDNNSEKDQTINALLTELDGFSSSEGVVVIGATNRLEMLDEALIRPGRFDRRIAIPLPDLKERIEILKIHSKNKRFKDNVDFQSIARMTMGFSGAGLETLMNESAIIAVGREKNTIDLQDIDDAYYKVIMNGYKKSIKDVNQEQLQLVAWHEAGHALVAKLLTKKSVPKVTIIPSTNGVGGATFIIPEKSGLHTKKDLINEIKTLYAGRIAEFLLTKEDDLVTTGASQDIKQATNLIIGMIKELGMTDEFGMLYISGIDGINESEILSEAKKISKKIYEETFELMKENQWLLENIANALLLKETIEEEELNQIILVKENIV